MSAVERAVAIAGSQSALARSLGISPQAVSVWVAEGRVPLPKIRPVSDLTGIPVADLLMDVAKAMDIEVVDVNTNE